MKLNCKLWRSDDDDESYLKAIKGLLERDSISRKLCRWPLFELNAECFNGQASLAMNLIHTDIYSSRNVSHSIFTNAKKPPRFEAGQFGYILVDELLARFYRKIVVCGGSVLKHIRRLDIPYRSDVDFFFLKSPEIVDSTYYDNLLKEILTFLITKIAGSVALIDERTD